MKTTNKPCTCDANDDSVQSCERHGETTKHTPGPWHTQNCKVLDSYAVSEVADCEFVQLSIYQARANARLIAAAPELLEACNELYAAYDKARRHLGVEFASPVMERAQQAITKATTGAIL